MRTLPHFLQIMSYSGRSGGPVSPGTSARPDGAGALGSLAARSVLVALMVSVTAPLPAAAQSGGRPGMGPTVPAPQEKARPAPPPALPGTRAEPSPVAPATKLPGEMQPTEALFDSINRGDTAAGRDAIGRGADLDARNVLGLTPLELAVDLGRHDLAFLLLSLRGASPGRAAATAPASPPVAAGAERRAAQRASSRPAAAAPTAPVASGPRLFAGNGGAPIPQAGFLGFDPAR